jgi:hypothetical protein
MNAISLSGKIPLHYYLPADEQRIQLASPKLTMRIKVRIKLPETEIVS